MPTIHYSDSTSLSQLGVKDAPKSADEIRTKLKRDQSYFDIPISRADNDEEQRELDGSTANDDNGKQQSKQKSIAMPDESKAATCSDTTDRQIDTNKKDSPFTDKSSADKSISIAIHTKSKATSAARKKKRTLDKSITSGCDNDTISNEDNQGDYDVPIAETLKLRREKRKAETDSTAKSATHNDISTPIAERLKRRRTNNAPDIAQQETSKSKTTRKRKASSSLNSNKTTEVTTPKSSKKKTCASKEDVDYSKTGIRQLPSGNKWSVEIGYHKKRCYPGTYEDKEHAVLANKVAREYLLATRDLQLTDDEIQSNIDLAKEAALKAVNDLLEDGGASDSISEEEEDKQPLEEEDNTSATTTSDGISIDREKHIQSKIMHRRQLLAWVRTARLACEKNMEEQPDFIQDTLNSSDQAHTSSAPSTPSVAGDLASEVANYQALTNTINLQQSSAEKTDVKPVGVYRVSNGWEVRVCYHGKNRYIGTFSSLDQATLANKVARNMLEVTRSSILSPEESMQNIKLAKEAALKAVSEMGNQSSEEHINGGKTTKGLSAEVERELDKSEIPVAISEKNGECKDQKARKKEVAASSPSRGITPALSEETNTNLTQGKKVATAAVASETRQDLEDVILKLPTHKEVKPTSPLPWYYNDLQQRIQGPYSTGQMRQWLEGGYIQNDLPLSHSRDGPFQELSTCYPDINKAFTCSVEMANESNGVECMAVDRSQKQSNDEHIVSSENKQWEYAVDLDGASTFESLWKKRTNGEADKDEDPHYQFFNGQSSKAAAKLGNGINEQGDSRPMEEDSQEVTLWECDVSGCTETFDTYEEAAQHELTCKKRSQQDDSNSK